MKKLLFIATLLLGVVGGFHLIKAIGTQDQESVFIFILAIEGAIIFILIAALMEKDETIVILEKTIKVQREIIDNQTKIISNHERIDEINEKQLLSNNTKIAELTTIIHSAALGKP